MQDQRDESCGSEASWSIVSTEGDLVNSDDYSISGSEPLPNNSDLGLNDEDNQSNVNGSDYHCLSESDSDGDTDMTDVEEMDDIYEPSDSAPELNSNEPAVKSSATQAFDDTLYSSDLSDNCISVDIRTERRIQIFVIASVLCTLLVGALFGDLYALQQIRCHSPQTPEEMREPLKLSEQVLSFEPLFNKPLWIKQQSRDKQIKEPLVVEEIVDTHELSQCHRDLNDAIKTAASNSVLMRYMRSRNIQLETLVQELQSFVDLQRKELETLQSNKNAPLQSGLFGPETTDDSPCTEEDQTPSDQPTISMPKPSPLPDEEQSKPQFKTCTQVERSFLNLTRSFLHKMATTMANSTALTLFMEARPELNKLTNWFQKQTLKTFPRMIENVRTGWRSKFRSYMQRVGNALSAPAITNLTKPRNVVGAIKKQIKSVFNKLTRNKWMYTEENFCMSNATCDLLMDLGNFLAEDQAFRSNLTPKQADSYVEFLKHIPSRQCKNNSTLVNCERCWWIGRCDGVKKKCNLRRWQRQTRIDPKLYIEKTPKVKEIFKGLGWIDSEDPTLKQMTEPVGPPRHKRTIKKEKYCQNDWLMRRGAKRAEHRRRSVASAWLFDRHAQRAELRHSRRASDWFFDRQAQRAALRHN